MRTGVSRAGRFVRGVAGELRHAGEWRVSTKIMVGFLLVAMAAIFFFSKQSEARSTDVLTQMQSQLLTSLAQSVAIQVESQVLQYRRDAIEVATDPSVADYMTLSPPEQARQGSVLLARLRNPLQADPDYRQLLIVDTHGKVVISNEPGVQGEDYSDREFFRIGRGAPQDAPYISDIVLAEDHRTQVIYVASPIRDQVGTVVGVAAIRLSPEHVAAPLKGRDVRNQPRNGYLVSRQGLVLANSFDPGLNYRALAELDPTQAADARRQFNLDGIDNLHQDQLANLVAGTSNSGFTQSHLVNSSQTDVIGYAPVPGPQRWTVMVTEDQAAFTADVSALSRNQFFNALVLALIIGGLVIFAGRLFESTERESLSDPLTGLANRRFFQEILLRELRRAQRNNTPVALIIADIDHFKGINDTYGHNIGDEVLEQVAGIMLASVRATDFVVRYGGEEFVVLMPETRAFDAFQVAEKLRRTVGDTIMESTSRLGITLKCTISAGVAAYPTEGKSGEELILHADKALYWAKQNGRNRVAGSDDVHAPVVAPLPAHNQRRENSL